MYEDENTFNKFMQGRTKEWDAKPAKNAAEGGQTPSGPQPSAPPRSLLVLKLQITPSPENLKFYTDYLGSVAKKIGAEVAIEPEGMELQLHQDLGPLTSAIAAQTEAITRLAVSNEAIVGMLMQAMGDDDPDPDASPTHYMDGTPIR